MFKDFNVGHLHLYCHFKWCTFNVQLGRLTNDNYVTFPVEIDQASSGTQGVAELAAEDALGARSIKASSESSW